MVISGTIHNPVNYKLKQAQVDPFLYQTHMMKLTALIILNISKHDKNYSVAFILIILTTSISETTLKTQKITKSSSHDHKGFVGCFA